MCLVLSGSVLHFDIALDIVLLWKFTNHDDFALTVRYRSFLFARDLLSFLESKEYYVVLFVLSISLKTLIRCVDRNEIFCLHSTTNNNTA